MGGVGCGGGSSRRGAEGCAGRACGGKSRRRPLPVKALSALQWVGRSAAADLLQHRVDRVCGVGGRERRGRRRAGTSQRCRPAATALPDTRREHTPPRRCCSLLISALSNSGALQGCAALPRSPPSSISRSAGVSWAVTRLPSKMKRTPVVSMLFFSQNALKMRSNLVCCFTRNTTCAGGGRPKREKTSSFERQRNAEPVDGGGGGGARRLQSVPAALSGCSPCTPLPGQPARCQPAHLAALLVLDFDGNGLAAALLLDLVLPRVVVVRHGCRAVGGVWPERGWSGRDWDALVAGSRDWLLASL